jgi:hypothetical protein
MVEVTYEIVEHDGGWAYRVAGAYSETFPTRELAKHAAEDAAAKQQQAGQTDGIIFQDAEGAWHQELAPGSDRPATRVAD